MITPYDIAMKAKEIFDGASSEVDYRCSARCAYYSLYHFCKGMDDKRLAEPSKEQSGVHYSLISRFLGSEDDGLRRLGVDLNTCRTLRVKADYRLDQSFRRQDAYKVLRVAEKLIIGSSLAKKEDRNS